MDDKRQLIFDATEKIIATKGLQGLSMQQIASEAGVATGTIYRYFKDKDELIAELRKNVLRLVADRILADIDNGSIEDRFKRVWHNIVNFGRQRTSTNLSYEQYIHLPGIDNDAHQGFERQTFGKLHELFEQGRELKIFHPLQDKVLFAIAFEPAVSLGRSIRRGQMQYDVNEVEQACHLCWLAILTPTYLQK